MPRLVDRLPTLDGKSLSRRASRAARAMSLVAVAEPGNIALQLHGFRIRLGRLLHQATKEQSTESLGADAPVIHSLTADYCRVTELLLRLARVPQAPPGARGETKGRTLQVEPEAVDTPELPAAEPADTHNQGDSAVLPQDSQS